MTAHSVLVGGSIAERRMKCPASFQEQLKAPPGVTSIYAEAGTAMHEAMAHWLQNPDDDLVGLVFNEFTITQDDVDTLLTPAWDALVDLQEAYGGGFRVTHLEKRVAFPGIAGAFGAVDVILELASHFIVADFKFGAGVAVACVHDDGQLNEQLLFYLAGAAKLAKKRQMVIAIIQPTFLPHFTHAKVSRDQLTAFAVALQAAIALATQPDPPRVRGEWCRWAPCKVTCSLWTGPLLDLSALGQVTPESYPNHDWGTLLAIAKRLVDSALMYEKEIDAALINHLREGGKAPGFALKYKERNRKWLDDADHVAGILRKLGLPESKIWQKKLQTFTVVDSAAKKLRVAVPDELRPKPPATKLTLTYAGDPATVEPTTLTSQFAEALKLLQTTKGTTK